MNITQEQHFDIGGQKRLVKFGTNATAVFCDERGVSLSEFQSITFQDIKPGELRDIIWSGLVAGAHKEDKDIDFNKWDVGEWIDDLDEDTLDEVFDLIQGPQGNKKKEPKT